MNNIETRRSLLQRKQRTELLQIASALGGEPSSRARKAEIIQLIIDLTESPSPSPSAAKSRRSSSSSTATNRRSSPSSSAAGSDKKASQAKAATDTSKAKPSQAATDTSKAKPSKSATAIKPQRGATLRPTPKQTKTKADDLTAAPAPENVDAATPDKTATTATAAKSSKSKAATPKPKSAKSDSATKPATATKPVPGAKSVSATKSVPGTKSAHAKSSGPATATKPATGTKPATPTKAADPEPGNRRKRRRGRDRDRDREEAWSGDSVGVEGHLDLRDEGYGFLRVNGCLPDRNDAYVPVKTIRQFGLRRGDHLTGTSRPANRSEKNPALLDLLSINDGPPELIERPRFEQLTPVHASRQIILERPGDETARLIDLVTPIGLGQRILVHAPRRSGVSKLLSSLISAIEINEPDIHVMGLFLNQRPEEITAVRSIVKNGEVEATSFDQTAEDHVQTAEMTVERAKRLAELGWDVALVVDGITALARSYNTALSNAGKAYSGRVESGAVHMPKKLFGVGRNLAEAGSVTMIATIASEEPRFRSLDATVREEFADTANTELHLNRWAAERGVFPAVDMFASLSRDEGHFLDTDMLGSLQTLRRRFTESAGDGPGAVVSALQAVLQQLRSTTANAELLRNKY